jgi:hypothetical protein
VRAAPVPDRFFTGALILRSAVVWAALRAALFLLGPGLKLALHVSLLVVATTVALTLHDARRRHEDIFLANLGVPGLSRALIAAATALALELAVALGARA